MLMRRLTLLALSLSPAARAQAAAGTPFAPAGSSEEFVPLDPSEEFAPRGDADEAAQTPGDGDDDAWVRLAARADAPFEELSRLVDSATSTIEAFHRRFESRLGEMSGERILSAVRGVTLANAIALLLYAPLTAFVSLVSGRLGRFLHASFAGATGWSLLVAEMPLRVRGRRGSVRFLSTQVGRSSALLFAAAAAWRSGPVGMLLSALTMLNAVYSAYVTAVHPAFRAELEQLADMCRGLSAVSGQLWRAALRALNTATAGPPGGPPGGQRHDRGEGRSRTRGHG